LQRQEKDGGTREEEDKLKLANLVEQDNEVEAAAAFKNAATTTTMDDVAATSFTTTTTAAAAAPNNGNGTRNNNLLNLERHDWNVQPLPTNNDSATEETRVGAIHVPGSSTGSFEPEYDVEAPALVGGDNYDTATSSGQRDDTMLVEATLVREEEEDAAASGSLKEVVEATPMDQVLQEHTRKGLKSAGMVACLMLVLLAVAVMTGVAVRNSNNNSQQDNGSVVVVGVDGNVSNTNSSAEPTGPRKSTLQTIQERGKLRCSMPPNGEADPFAMPGSKGIVDWGMTVLVSTCLLLHSFLLASLCV